MSDAAFVLDPAEGRFLAANPAACDLLGFTLEELRETPISRIHPGELAQLRELVEGVLRDGHGATTSLTCRTRGGAFLPTEMTLWAFGGDDRVAVLVLVRDRSEHRRRRRPGQ